MMKFTGKKAFIAGVADDKGLGWAIAKSLAEEGCQIYLGTWVPLYNIFSLSLKNNKLDLTLANGKEMNIAEIYPLDAAFDAHEDVPSNILDNKRYKGLSHFAIKDVAAKIEATHGKIDFLIHSLANAKEIRSPLLETSRKGYLDAINSSSYSFVSLVKHFSPILNNHGSILNLSYLASHRIVPGYGGGMSSAKAALESDTKTLAYEIAKKYPEKKLRINCISSGAIASRAAKAIGFIEEMIDHSKDNAPLPGPLLTQHVGNTAKFLLSEDAAAITASTLYVDNGMHALGPIPTVKKIASPDLKEKQTDKALV